MHHSVPFLFAGLAEREHEELEELELELEELEDEECRLALRALCFLR